MTPPPDRFATALAYAAERAWNSEQTRYRFKAMACARAGVVERQAAFVCRSRVRDRRTGSVFELRVVVLADGTPVG